VTAPGRWLNAILSQPEESWYAGLGAYIAFLCGVQGLTLLLCASRVTISGAVALAILGASFGLGCLEWLRVRPGKPVPSALPAGGAEGEWPRGLILVLPILCLAALWGLAFIVPDLSWDGRAYHIPTMHFWSLLGRVGWIEAYFPATPHMNGYPKGAELMGFVLVRGFGESQLANTVNLLFLPLGVLGLGLLARALGATARAAAAAASLYAMVPVCVAQSITTYVDAAFSCAAIALIAMVVRTVGLLSAGRVPWALLPALGGAMGLVVSTKSPGLLFAANAAAVVMLMAVAQVGWGRGRRAARFAGAAVVFASAALAIAALVGGYWYVRNYLFGGSPIYPAGVQLAGHTIFPGEQIGEVVSPAANTPEYLRGLPGLVRILFTWLQGGTRWPISMADYDSRAGGLGYLWVLGCLPAAVLMLGRMVRRSTPTRWRRPLQTMLLMTGLQFLATPMNWWARYTVWIYALGLPCFAVVVGEVFRDGGAHWAKRLWVRACVAIAMLEGILCLGYMIDHYLCPTWMIHDEPTAMFHPSNWRKPYWQRQFPQLRGTVLEEILVSEDAVAVGPLLPAPEKQALLLGWLSTPIGRRRILSLPHNPGAEAMAKLKAFRARWILWEDSLPLPECLLGVAAERVRAGCFTVLKLAHEE
jgi:hypothetical protein